MRSTRAGSAVNRKSLGPLRLARSRVAAAKKAMTENRFKDLRGVIEKLPHWLRADLSSTDAGLRERADDALHAMLTAFLSGGEDSSSSTP